MVKVFCLGVSLWLYRPGLTALKVVSVGTVLAIAVEAFGRKKCLLVGSLGQGLTMLWIGGYSAVVPAGKTVPASYVSIISVYLYAVFYCVGWGPLA